MPSALVAALAAPIREVQSLVGPGRAEYVSDDPAVAFGKVRDALTEVSTATRQAWNEAAAHWSGSAADGAADYFAATAAAVDAMAARADHLGVTADTAADAVARAHRRLQAIVEDFESRAATLEPHLDSPAAAQQLLAEARSALDDATAVVDELRVELDGRATALSTPTQSAAAPSSPAPTTPTGLGSPAMPAMGAGSGGAAPMSPLSGSGGTSGSGLGGLLGDLAAWSTDNAQTPDATTFGDGVAVRLPDGSTAEAPNAVAASAVRHALTQLGVPYNWGGSTPGVGLDCSGLTQWAYHEAGLNLPRLAQEQDIGAAVDAGELRPGDLAVWDGHVAMIVGNGTMIEAGDPVHLSPIRTTNAGQGFQGFWRPTA